MSRNYKFHNPSGIYFVSFATINWIDVFTRPLYKDLLLDSLQWCQENKGLHIHAWCIMTSHVHLIISSESNPIGRTLGSLKTFTSNGITEAIRHNAQESRREWMLWMMERAGRRNPNNERMQFWQQHNHPIELWTVPVMRQKVDYCHNNPVVEGFCLQPEQYPHSSAADYAGGQGPLKIALLW